MGGRGCWGWGGGRGVVVLGGDERGWGEMGCGDGLRGWEFNELNILINKLINELNLLLSQKFIY